MLDKNHTVLEEFMAEFPKVSEYEARCSLGSFLFKGDDVLKKLGAEEIKAVGETFDPNLHDAVMHVEDENFGENTISKELKKGYKLKDRIIRHSMVVVAN